MYVPTNRKPRVAVCISGQLRKLGTTQLPKAFSNLTPDIYIHTWDDEYNPNLPHVGKYFPDAEIQTEKYSDTFDGLFESTTQAERFKFRYHFAQFYTISKSLQMCYNSGKEYDLVFRVRTDSTFPMPLYMQEDLFREQLVLLNKHIHNHYIHFYNNVSPASPTDVPESHRKWTSIKIKSMYNGYAVLDDWFWISNMLALNELAQIDTIDLVRLAESIKRSYQESISNSSDLALKSPCAWSEIFKQHNIALVSDSTLGAQGGVQRLPKEQQQLAPGHGDIT